MIDRTTRRRVIKTTGAAALFGLAGCSSGGDGASNATPTSTSTGGNSSNGTEPTMGSGPSSLRGPRHGDDLPPDQNPEDGYPPEFETVPKERDINPDEFETLTRSNTEIKLVPTDVAYYWYARGEARFVDTRSESEYDVSHVFGAVLSPAGDGRDLPDDPALEWPDTSRVVTYCDCPHHLSSLRAASLMSRGTETVYALDEGFSAWRDHNFPLAGSDTGRVPPTRVIEGSVPRRYGGETAWAYHVDSNQREATRIADDGSYELELRFVDLTDQSRVRVETPAYELTKPIGELTSGTITTDGSLSGSTTFSGGTNDTASGGSTTTTSSFSVRD